MHASLRTTAGRAGGPWTVTALATVASTYALDAVATAAGLALVASGLLAGLDGAALGAALALSYIAWAVGLRANLGANWALLCRTGTSTNLLSKAAHDLAAARALGLRARRVAAAAGYVVTEVAKEVPYYAGASGVVLAGGASTGDAVLFLTGANVGAAAYELGLARTTLSLLGHRPAPDAHASFEEDWAPRAYLSAYYTEVEPDERETIAFLVEAMREAEPGAPVLCYGVGPTLHHVFLVAERASEIHLADYLEGNLRELEDWLAGAPGAHDWRPFVAYTLECEGIVAPSAAQVDAREALTRRKVTRLLRADAREPEPVGAYATVLSAYCADSATADRDTWATYLRHIAGAVRPGGLFLTAALRRCRSYRVGPHLFPSADVDEHDVRAVLDAAFTPSTTAVEVRELPGDADKGYASIVLASVRAPVRSPETPGVHGREPLTGRVP